MNETNQVRVRFAPSPTGHLHIGSARTALFNWLFARANNGKFILRIEDTDLERSNMKYLDEILASLKWLGLDWDEDLYFQSKRFDIYKKQAERLVSKEEAYYEEIKNGKAVRLKIPGNEVITFYDIIHGKIEVNSSTLDDTVLMKSDGSPTYNFACVVDDIDMRITHIIRGDDHIANTPKQILIYRALDITPPKFAHIPLILSSDRSRMSKRHGATSIAEYKSHGYLSEALVNFLALIGWSPKGNREKLDIDKIISLFSLKGINKTGAVFDVKKLNWLNSEYIKEKPLNELTDFVAAHLIERGILKQEYNREWLNAAVECYKTRFCNIDDFIEKTDFFFNDDFTFDPEAVKQHLSDEKTRQHLLELSRRFKDLDNFELKSIEETVRSLAEELGIQAGGLIHPARVAITGRSSAAGLFEIMYLLGKDRVIKRFDSISHKL